MPKDSNRLTRRSLLRASVGMLSGLMGSLSLQTPMLAAEMQAHGRRLAAPRWRSLNPGAGGQVQGVSCDPQVQGRMYLCSDMEGFYRSDDYGASWLFLAMMCRTACASRSPLIQATATACTWATSQAWRSQATPA